MGSRWEIYLASWQTCAWKSLIQVAIENSQPFAPSCTFPLTQPDPLCTLSVNGDGPLFVLDLAPTTQAGFGLGVTVASFAYGPFSFLTGYRKT